MKILGVDGNMGLFLLVDFLREHGLDVDVLAWYPWIYTQRIRHGIANFDQKPTHYYDYCNHTLEKDTAMELPHAYSETWNPVKELKATWRRRSTCRSVVAIPKSLFADARTCERQTAGLVAGLCRQDSREQSLE